ncbi:MAG: 2-amino-4-hydroxy-6-hydroxymethyldihydropteridine diphosphokinase, partial [Terrimicrobiaceae bacterium]|nr:2-amino-4-hydroxy-6-hydroxymethyldihydropteridine diphosphokinase [Terrimicrobiaceae bacterium]
MMRRLRPAGIGLGSNVGERRRALEAGIEFLRGLHEGPEETFRVAGILETEPVGCAPGTAPFLNTVAEIETSLEAGELLGALRGFETAMGRPSEREKNTPRILDLDLLYLGDEVIRLPHLEVPHPRLAERAFVLGPLAEIRPQRR